jgi:hypothetical protein
MATRANLNPTSGGFEVVKNNRRAVLHFGLAVLFLWLPVSSRALDKENTQITSRELEQRGQQLRAEIESIYKNLKASGSLVSAVHGNKIDDVVLKYVPTGISFDEAENILRFAGFKVYPRPEANPPGKRPDRYDVSAWIDPLDKGLIWKVQVIVSLSPKAPGDYSNVSNISAGIFYNTL